MFYAVNLQQNIVWEVSTKTDNQMYSSKWTNNYSFDNYILS